MFIGRETELRKLNKMYASNRLEVAIIYGRRRVGKTTLINEFCKDKRTVFFSAIENSAEQNLEALSNAVMRESRNTNTNAVYKSFVDAFLQIKEMAKDERLIFVIDEYPYLAQAESSISSLIQNFLDHEFKDSKLFLILCGSSMSFMENQVLGYQSPLYGRRTAQFKIMPFDYNDTAKWFPEYSLEDKALMYGITGGVPLYIEQFDPQLSIRENLIENLFDRNAFLFEETSNLLKQELREPAMYNAVITAIAAGKSKMSEIASTVGMETGLCTKYIQNLISLGILKREVPVTEQNSKRPIYLIDDLFFRFWYTFVLPNITLITSDRFEDAYPQLVEKYLSNYMGNVFERMCREYILRYDNDIPFILSDIGQWWGGNPATKKQAQIDIVTLSADKESCIVGSCKYRNELVGMDAYTILQSYAEAMGRFKKYYYYIFSKSGFSEKLLNLAGDDETLRLITLEDIYR